MLSDVGSIPINSRDAAAKRLVVGSTDPVAPTGLGTATSQPGRRWLTDAAVIAFLVAVVILAANVPRTAPGTRPVASNLPSAACRPNAVTVANGPDVGGATQEKAHAMLITNTSSTPCTLHGYVSIVALDRGAPPPLSTRPPRDRWLAHGDGGPVALRHRARSVGLRLLRTDCVLHGIHRDEPTHRCDVARRSSRQHPRPTRSVGPMRWSFGANRQPHRRVADRADTPGHRRSHPLAPDGPIRVTTLRLSR